MVVVTSQRSLSTWTMRATTLLEESESGGGIVVSAPHRRHAIAKPYQCARNFGLSLVVAHDKRDRERETHARSAAVLTLNLARPIRACSLYPHHALVCILIHMHAHTCFSLFFNESLLANRRHVHTHMHPSHT